MNILFVGSFSTKSLLEQYPDKGLDTYKTSAFLIRGFRQIDDVKLDVVTAPNLGSWPKFPQKRIRRIVEEDGTISVSFINFPFVKQLIIMRHLYKEACRFINKNKDKTYVIIPYVVYHQVRVGVKLKKRYGSKVVLCQIVPDIFSPNTSIKKKLNKLAERNAAQSDNFVFFTKAMADYYGIDEKRYIVMESLIDGDTYKKNTEILSKTNEKACVAYTGALGVPNGVGKLIEMMRIMKRNDFELLVTGRGPLTERFESEAVHDRRIRFLGTVPKDDVFNYQLTADILINPRSDRDAPIDTKYMFPSKLMEYMLTGNAVLTCRMSGIPHDYYNYVFVSENDTPEGLASSLNEILDMSSDERKKKGEEARKYILDNKTIQVQTQRIVELLKRF